MAKRPKEIGCAVERQLELARLDLRNWIQMVREFGELREVDGADRDLDVVL